MPRFQNNHGPISTKWQTLKLDVGPLLGWPIGVIPIDCNFKTFWAVQAICNKALPGLNMSIHSQVLIWPWQWTLDDVDILFSMWYFFNVYRWGRYFGLDLGNPFHNVDLSYKVKKQ